MMDDPRQKISFVKFQLLCTVSGYHDASGSIKGQYGYKYYSCQRQNQAKNPNYRKMLLFSDIDSKTGQMVYTIEGNISNERLWVSNSQICDNGVFTIGSYIKILYSFSIINRLGKEIPILEYRHLAVIMEPQRMVHSVCADFGLVQNNTRAFVFNNEHITIKYSFPEATKCSGLLCDQQRVREVLQGNRGCGFCSMNSSI